MAIIKTFGFVLFYLYGSYAFAGHTCSEILKPAAEQQIVDQYDFTQEPIWVSNPSPSKPKNMRFALNEQVLQEAIENSDPKYKKALVFIFDQLRTSHVSFNEFNTQLETSALDFVHANPQLMREGAFVNYSPFSEISGKDDSVKSNFWTFQLLMANREKLGLPKKVATFKSVRKMIKYMRKHKIKDIVLTDDASYSGTQMHSLILGIDYYLGLFSGVNIHIILPYMAGPASQRMESLEKKALPRWARKLKNINFYTQGHPQGFIQTVDTALRDGGITSEIHKAIEEILSFNYDQSLLYFDHKVPDFVSAVSSRLASTPSHIVEGLVVPNKAGELINYRLVDNNLHNEPYRSK